MDTYYREGSSRAGSASQALRNTSKKRAYARFVEFELQIRRDDCSNWCQQVAEWLKAVFDEEISVWPSNASMPFSDLWDF